MSGNNLDQVFNIAQGPTVSIAGLTVTGGNAGMGGGIENAGTLALTSCSVSDNAAETFGGGIANIGGVMTITDCTINSNSTLTSATQLAGGGIANAGPGGMTITNCTIAYNSTNGLGGGISTSSN